MSYNSYSTRRTPSYGTPPAQSGQKKPVVTNYFVAGGVQTPPVKQEIKPQQQQAKPIVSGANPPRPDSEEKMEYNEDGSPKKKWMKKGKISKSEKLRRRNLRLTKILHPKNAVMILNELVKGCKYQDEELPIVVHKYKGTVQFEGQEFTGTGPTKTEAKNAAAEAAIRHVIRHKELLKNGEANGDEQMDTGEDNKVTPWSHLASLAMYKLLSTWGEDPEIVDKISAEGVGTKGQTKKPFVSKPAKQMPPNPETLNPIMVLHQMHPDAVWSEVVKSGTPPNVVMTMSVTVDGKQYKGTGSNKKLAKKQAAYVACHQHLKVNYPPDVYKPSRN